MHNHEFFCFTSFSYITLFHSNSASFSDPRLRRFLLAKGRTSGVGSRGLVAVYSRGDMSEGVFAGIYIPVGGAAADPNYWNVRRYLQKIHQSISRVIKKLLRCQWVERRLSPGVIFVSNRFTIRFIYTTILITTKIYLLIGESWLIIIKILIN